MRLVMGTYRGKRYLPETLESLERNLKGCDEIVFVNDSGDLEVAKWLKDYGQVVTLPQVGFKKAMSVACSLMTPPYSAWWEEDFILDREIDLNKLADEIEDDSRLAQFVLMRQPWFPNEVECGSVVDALVERLEGPISLRDGKYESFWIHQITFSTNPGVWHPVAWKWDWPQCGGSEEEKTKYLVRDDKSWFALQYEQSVTHVGERTGYGY